MNLEIYLKQHDTIKQEIREINALISKESSEENIREIVRHINLLAGKINMHLAVEDQYLYPKLRESKENEVREMTEMYMEEMSSLQEEFNTYKVKFNTRTKLKETEKEFARATQLITHKIMSRIEKEEKELYQVL